MIDENILAGFGGEFTKRMVWFQGGSSGPSYRRPFRYTVYSKSSALMNEVTISNNVPFAR